MSNAPVPGSPEDLIEQGFVMISRGIFRLMEAERFSDAEAELSKLVTLFTEDHLRLYKKVHFK